MKKIKILSVVILTYMLTGCYNMYQPTPSYYVKDSNDTLKFIGDYGDVYPIRVEGGYRFIRRNMVSTKVFPKYYLLHQLECKDNLPIGGEMKDNPEIYPPEFKIDGRVYKKVIK